MSLADTLQNSINIKNQKDIQKNQKKTTEDKILNMVRDTQMKVWQLLIEQKINDRETNIAFSLRHHHDHCYLNHYEYKTNIASLLNTPEGASFVQWLQNNGLTYSISKDHDGCGMESWDTLTIKVA
jgi:hypothetical protein